MRAILQGADLSYYKKKKNIKGAFWALSNLYLPYNMNQSSMAISSIKVNLQCLHYQFTIMFNELILAIPCLIYQFAGWVSQCIITTNSGDIFLIYLKSGNIASLVMFEYLAGCKVHTLTNHFFFFLEVFQRTGYSGNFIQIAS
jgi:hypothetical protein